MPRSTGPLSLLACLALVVSLLLPAPAGAQTNSEGFWKMRFNFNPPGARPTAMGGSFIGLADDATAAESNPAGLTVLLYPQLSLEGEGFRYGILDDPIAGSLPEEGAYDRSRPSRVISPTFASFVLPVRNGTLSVFRHELVNYENALDYGFLPPDGEYISTTTADVSVRVANTGVGLAQRIGSRASIGVAGGVASLALRDNGAGIRQAYGTAADYRYRSDGADGRGHSVFLNLGGILRFGEAISIGAVYKHRGAVGGLQGVYEDFVVEEEGAPVDTLLTPYDFSFDVPDAYGIGIASRATERLTLTLDAQRILYSQLTRWLRESADYDHFEYDARDGVDVRAGAEYVVFIGRSPLALRGGAARVAAANFQAVEVGERATGEAHYSGSMGIGSVISRRLQLDAALEVSRPQTSGTLAIVYFFGRT